MSDHDNPLLGLSRRLPPSNVQAEQTLLGALMANNQACRHVEGFLRSKHFSDPVHASIYWAILRDYRDGRPFDAITLRRDFEPTDLLHDVGGAAYLGQLTTAVIGIIDAGEYGRSIHDCWMRRELIDIGEEIVNRAFGADPEIDANAQWDAATHRLAMLPEGVQEVGHSGAAATAPSRPHGLNDPDTYGDLPRHAVALTDDEIDTLWRQHLYAANRTRPRKRVKQSDRDVQLHAWYSSRAALFERLLPQDDPEEADDPGRAPISMDDVEAAQAGDGMMVGGEAVDMRHPLDRDVEPIIGRDGEILGYHEVSPKREFPGPAYLPLRQAGQT